MRPEVHVGQGDGNDSKDDEEDTNKQIFPHVLGYIVSVVSVVPVFGNRGFRFTHGMVVRLVHWL